VALPLAVHGTAVDGERIEPNQLLMTQCTFVPPQAAQDGMLASFFTVTTSDLPTLSHSTQL
jgi:hypothetical protein